MDSDLDLKEDLYKFRKNLFNNMCRIFIKLGASRQDEYIIRRTLSRCSVRERTYESSSC